MWKYNVLVTQGNGLWDWDLHGGELLENPLIKWNIVKRDLCNI